MATFVDASALTSIIVGETDARALETRLDAEREPIISAIALWETAVAVAKIKNVEIEAAWREVQRYVDEGNFLVRPIERKEAAEALGAFVRYGKRSVGPAKLNMGDCFAYACAKTNGASLLYKGNDFIHTDLA